MKCKLKCKPREIKVYSQKNFLSIFPVSYQPICTSYCSQDYFFKNADCSSKFLRVLYKSYIACSRTKFAWQKLLNFNLSLIFAQLLIVLLGLSLSNCRHLQCQHFKNTVELNFFHSHVGVAVGQKAITLNYLVKLACINLVTSSYISI